MASKKPKKIDNIDIWLEALFEINHPELIHNPDFPKKQKEWIAEEYKKAGGKNAYGAWIDISFKGIEYSVHVPEEDDYFSLLTNRNQNVYSHDELQLIRKSKVCILGQSIGGNVAQLAAHSGFGHLALADFDTLDPTNLNRVVYGNALDIGSPKIQVVEEIAKAVNPYLKIDIFDKGISAKNLSDYINGAKVILDLVDDFPMKIKVREEARELGIPVLMTTNVGRWRIVDIERYDLDPHQPLFNGLVDESVLFDISEGKLSPKDINRYAREIVGPENIDPRALDSLPKIGARLGLVGRPQIGSTVASNAGTSIFAISWILGCFKDFGTPASGRSIIKENELIASV